MVSKVAQNNIEEAETGDLQMRDDRNKFIYFRLQGSKKMFIP